MKPEPGTFITALTGIFVIADERLDYARTGVPATQKLRADEVVAILVQRIPEHPNLDKEKHKSGLDFVDNLMIGQTIRLTMDLSRENEYMTDIDIYNEGRLIYSSYSE